MDKEDKSAAKAPFIFPILLTLVRGFPILLAALLVAVPIVRVAGRKCACVSLSGPPSYMPLRTIVRNKAKGLDDLPDGFTRANDFKAGVKLQ